MKTALSIDVGGTKIYNTIINENGEIVGEIEKHSTPKTFAEIKSLFEEIIKKHENEVDVIAFATCGAVNNTNDGILGSTGNIAKEYPSMDLKSLSKKPVYVENDANCAAWAEHIIGSSKGMPYSVMLTLGTGVGGGIILDNKLYKGKNGAAGEMHFKMRTDKHRKCTCGSWDCFEAYASGTGLKKTAEEISGNPDVTTYDVIEGMKVRGLEGGQLIVESGKWKVESQSSQTPSPDGERICGRTERSESGLRKDGAYCGEATNAELLEQRANSRQGRDGVILSNDSEISQAQQTDKDLSPYRPNALSPSLAQRIFDKWQNDILEGIIGLANIFDPDCIVLSGSMAEFVNIEYLEREANKEIVTTPFKVLKASAGNYSGMIGAGLLALGKYNG